MGLCTDKRKNARRNRQNNGLFKANCVKKLNDPGEFTIKELQALQKGLDVPAEAFQTAVDNLFLNKPASK